MPDRYRFRGRRMAAAALLTLLGGSACTSYVAAGVGTTPSAGALVRLDFAAPREVGMGSVTANGVHTLTGELVAADSATFTVAAMRAISDGGYETLGPGLSVEIPRQAVREVRISRISPARSAGLVASLAGLGLLVVGALASAGGEGGGPSSGGNTK
ncbi:MAG TPA: hypothetical protein VLK84_28845 [Longimicrobium sp.]|nr:hypothetical protein [Longimicrobium sp.]